MFAEWIYPSKAIVLGFRYGNSAIQRGRRAGGVVPWGEGLPLVLLSRFKVVLVGSSPSARG